MTALAPCKETISQTYIINYNRVMEINSKSKYTMITSVDLSNNQYKLTFICEWIMTGIILLFDIQWTSCIF